MKRTNQELNRMLDEATADIRQEELDAAVVNEAAERVWTRLASERASASAGIAPVERIRNCSDFQALIPAYLHGSLSDARAMLLEDHTQECIPCRKALKQARTGSSAAMTEERPDTAQTSSIKTAVMRWGIAAAIILGCGLAVYPLVQRLTNSVGTLSAMVQASNGPVYRVADANSRAIAIGEELQKGERIRTSRDAGAVVKLKDGSLIEMKERSEFSLTETAQGMTINLERGHIIVQAAKQRPRHLYVATSDSLVSVTGTIFSVNSGTKGSRVSVIEGEVQVEHGGQKDILHPGNQLSTNLSLDRIPVQDEIAWSRDADRYKQMLTALSEVNAQVSRPGVRYSTRLLDLAPEGTVLYVAIPNLSETLNEANRLLQERIQQNPALREWWEKEQSAKHGELSVNEVINRIREFGAYLGPEIVVSAAMNAQGEPDTPVVLTELKDASGFRSYVDQQLQTLAAGSKKAPAVRFLDDPLTTNAPAKTSGRVETDLFVWINGDVMAAAPELASLQRVATAMKMSSVSRFANTTFHSQLATLYRDGAGLIVAADLEKIIARSVRSGQHAVNNASDWTQTLQKLGVFDLKTFMLELKEANGQSVNRATVTFDQTRRGMASWLAAPGPMGSLEFISPDASLVAACVVKQPSLIVEDLMAADLWKYLQEAGAAHGFDVRNDLAAPLGGEFAFAVDGPLLPIPSWKLVFEVYDQARLQQTLERLVQQINPILAQEGKPGLQWDRVEVNGRTFYTLKLSDTGLEMDYTFINGYFVAAPSRALVERAIKYQESGYTLLRSQRFIAALPGDKQANFSAVFYQNLAPALGSLSALAQRMGQSGSQNKQQALPSLATAAPTLAYVYAQSDRLIISANGEGGLLGLNPGSLLGLPGMQQIMGGVSGAKGDRTVKELKSR